MVPPSVEIRDGSSRKIFISYRRDDTQQVAGRLYDRLADAFGEDLVLKDVDSIPYGVDFRDHSTRLARESQVVLVLIGPRWSGPREDGARRIDDEADLVRLEVEAALQHCPRVIPVLVDDAAMPASSDLPASIGGLSYLNAARLRHDPDFREDIRRLLSQLESSRSSRLGKGPSEPGSGSRAGEMRTLGDPATSFCWCPAGTFLMGSPTGDPAARRDEKPQVPVTLTRGYWLASTPVTQERWLAVMGTEPWKSYSRARQGADYPAVCMRWYDATAFCMALTERERAAGRLSWDWTYALPTEAQWEYACRAGGTSRFCFGDEDASLGEYAWFDRTTVHVGADHAHPVGKKRPNAWGLYDMHGNVWEWCRDSYAENLPGGQDPYNYASSPYRVGRGGEWTGDSTQARSAARRSPRAAGGNSNQGFRIACVPCT